MIDVDTVQFGHGSGGTLMSQLIDEFFVDSYIDKDLFKGDDATVLSSVSLNENQRIVMSTDSFVVDPHFFPGGDIGKLAVCGTINDVSTSGAVPVALSVAFVLEAGFKLEHLKQVCRSIAETSQEAGVPIITGDTKVVETGKCDGIYINTTGIGVVDKDKSMSGNSIRPGDVVLVSGTVGDHGICIMSQRDKFSFSTDLKSDCAPLNFLVKDVIEAAPDTRCFRDPTRGGLASCLNEFASQCDCDITINEVEVPVYKSVTSACEMLGLDPFQVANEGKMVVVVPPEQADAALSAMRSNKYGLQAAIIGYVEEKSLSQPKVFVTTPYGTKRILDKLAGQQLPRIC